jgi:hypothetical protein
MVETTPPQNKAIYFRTEKTDAEKLSKVRQYLVNQLDLKNWMQSPPIPFMEWKML